MDSLPDHLVEAVLLPFLGVADLVRLRMVAQRFRGLVDASGRFAALPIHQLWLAVDRCCRGGNVAAVRWLCSPTRGLGGLVRLKLSRTWFLELAAGSKCLPLVEFLIDSEPSPLFLSGFREDFDRALTAAAASGDLATLRWLRARFPEPHGIGGAALMEACRRGHMAAVAWLLDTFPPMAAHLFWGAASMVASHGHLRLLKWIIPRCGLIERWDQYQKLFELAIDAKHLTVAFWLFVEYLSDGARTEVFVDPLMRGAASLGRAAVLAWLFERYKPSVPYSDLASLAASCGSLETLLVVVNRSPVVLDKTALAYAACASDSLDIVEWAFANELMPSYNGMMGLTRHACLRGAVRIADRLISSNPQAVDSSSFIHICCSGHLGVAKLILAAQLPFSRNTLAVAMREAFAAGHVHVAEYLKNKFRIESRDMKSVAPLDTEKRWWQTYFPPGHVRPNLNRWMMTALNHDDIDTVMWLFEQHRRSGRRPSILSGSLGPLAQRGCQDCISADPDCGHAQIQTDNLLFRAFRRSNLRAVVWVLETFKTNPRTVWNMLVLDLRRRERTVQDPGIITYLIEKFPPTPDELKQLQQLTPQFAW